MQLDLGSQGGFVLLAIAVGLYSLTAGWLAKHSVSAAFSFLAIGALLGGAEGVLVAGLLLSILCAALGRGHAFVADSHSIAALERLEQLADRRELRPIDVAAPPPSRR